MPPDIVGYDPELKTQAQLYDPAAARALLDKFGYKDRDGDGYRETPDGKPLVLERWSAPTTLQRQADEQWKKNMDAIGLRIVFRKDRLPELRKMARLGKIPMRTDGWNADYPDAENYMQLLYGPNGIGGQENHARFRLPEYDKLYDQARRLPDSPERTKLFDRMTELVLAYAPWRLQEHRIEDQLRPAVDTELQAAPDPLGGLAVRRHRHDAALEVSRAPRRDLRRRAASARLPARAARRRRRPPRRNRPRARRQTPSAPSA